MNKRGFTLVELVITILVIGVLAVTVTPRFLGSDAEDAIALRDRVLQFTRNMQLRAMQNVNDTSCVKISATTIAPPASHDCAQALSTSFDADQVISSAGTDYTFVTSDQNSDAFSQIQFNNLGQPTNIACAGTCRITVGSFAVCLEQEGAVYAC